MTVRSEELRGALMATEEFRTALPGDAVRMPLNLPAPDLVWAVDEFVAAALLVRVQTHWIRLGESRPYWSSEMRPEFEPEAFEANRALFEETGQGEVDGLVAAIARYGFTPEQLPRAFDYGCGAGRMVGPMARAFKYVTGCDVSPRHLALSRMATRGAGELCPGGVAAVRHGGPVRPVVQHANAAAQSAAADRADPAPGLCHLLAPGGVAVFQLPTERSGLPLRAAGVSRRMDDPDTTEIHVLPQAVVFALAAGGAAAWRWRCGRTGWYGRPPPACRTVSSSLNPGSGAPPVAPLARR